MFRIVAGFAFLISAGNAFATLVAVYSKPGVQVDIAQMREVARMMRESPGIVPDTNFIVRIADSSVLTPEFSVVPGVSAYFWSNQTYRRAGYRMRGVRATYEADIGVSGEAEATLAKETIEVDPVPLKAWPTALQTVSMGPQGLTLNYSVAKAGRVAIEVFGMNGRRVARGKWNETVAGEYRRGLELRNGAVGPFVVRWTFGDVRVVRKVGPDIGKAQRLRLSQE